MESVNLVLKPSRWQSGLVRLLYLLSMLSVLLASLPVYIKVALFILLVASYWYQKKCTVNQTVAIRYSKEFEWQIAFAAEPYQIISLLGSTTVSSWVVVVQFRRNSKIAYLPIFKDAVSASDFRRLKVCLNLGGIDS